MTCQTCDSNNPSDSLQCQQCGANLYKSKIRIIREDGDCKTHYLFSQNYSIGRGKKNNIIIPDDSVSRVHAELIYGDGVFSICDMDSKNGSLLNNLAFNEKHVLHDHDCIQLGTVMLHYSEDDDLMLNPKRFDTIEFVQKEYNKLAENRQNPITTDDVLQTVLELIVSLVCAEKGAIIQLQKPTTLQYKLGIGFHDVKSEITALVEDERKLFDRAVKYSETQIEYKNVVKTSGECGTGPFTWQSLAIPLLATISTSEDDAETGEFDVLGLCYLSHNKQRNLLSRRKKELLTALVQQISLAMENDILSQQSNTTQWPREQQCIEIDIRKRLLPEAKLDPTIFSVVSFAEPCETISGDYFDLIPISDKEIGLAIGDICGKGVPASLLSSTAQAAIRSQLEFSKSPEQIVNNLNNLLIKRTASGVFLTLFFGILDLESNELNYVNAGHPPPVFITKKLEIHELAGTAPPLGIIESTFPTQRMMKFEPGEMMIMYTDGLIESQSVEKQIYGRKRLLDLIRSIFKHPQSNRYNLDYVVNNVKSDLIDFTSGARQADDLTLLAVKRKR